ncbi:patatin-like phospholipase family protein, partial [Poseidonibacter sp.]|uniref:patatin-like phospholipase family protein n=1 Tax=Poseidonibacter sp. TaxID=2321188 RepID=UPI003C782BEB
MIYGVALEGGGAKGAYHSGALKALDELGISIGGVAGTSIGAINGAYYLQAGSQALIEFWETVDPSYLFPENLELIQERLKDERSEDVLGLLKEIRETIASGGVSVD